MNDPLKNAEKGIKAAGLSVLAVATFAAVDALARALLSPDNVILLLGQYPKLLFLVPLITGAAAAYINWRKHA